MNKEQSVQWWWYWYEEYWAANLQGRLWLWSAVPAVFSIGFLSSRRTLQPSLPRQQGTICSPPSFRTFAPRFVHDLQNYLLPPPPETPLAAAAAARPPAVAVLLKDDAVFGILDTGGVAPAPSRTRLLRRLLKLDLPVCKLLMCFSNYYHVIFWIKKKLKAPIFLVSTPKLKLKLGLEIIYSLSTLFKFPSFPHFNSI